MKINDKHIAIGELRAETVLNALSIPVSTINVHTKGTFFSNYCEDLLNINEPNMAGRAIALSRDGLFHLLPEALFFHEDSLRNSKKKKNPQLPDKEHIFDFFVPFDTELFNVSLELEKSIQLLENGAVCILLKELYNIDIQQIKNEAIRKIAPLILHAAEIRGNYPLIAQLMSSATGISTQILNTVKTNHLTSGEKTEWPFAKIIFHIPQLTHQEYREQYSQLTDFVDFIAEWFFPFNQIYEYSVKDEKQDFVLKGNITLDYNTYL